jgi:predicted dehydrogenase
VGERKKYVLVGCGGRATYMFAKPLLNEFTKYCELAALVDNNPLRARGFNDVVKANLPVYTDFQEMLRKVDPDGVIITTRDSTHCDYIVQTLEAGKRAISEKPLCVDAKQCRDILAAAQKNKKKGGQCYVTHNARYGPAMAEMQRLLKDGAIGDIKSINFHENLDRKHGADYFRRWHRLKKNSGGLLIHKASHHFDQLNWLVRSTPNELVAQGGLMMYGKNSPFRHTRCDGCPHSSKCEFYADMWGSEASRKLYKDAETADGYIRDACVFDPEIDIEDQASVLYTYQNGVRVTYSLTAFATYEGMHIQFEGSKGRMEYKIVHDTKWAVGHNAAQHGMEKAMGEHLHLFTVQNGLVEIPIPVVEGGHGGADTGLQHDFFGRPFDSAPTDRQAAVEEAIQAVLIGHAANVSMANGSQPVRVQDFLKHG